MRVIFNIHSDKAAMAAGWRAKAVEVNQKATATLDEALAKVPIKKGRCMRDLIVVNDRLQIQWVLIVNGVPVPADSGLDLEILDSTQFHLMLNPKSDPSPH